jgi:hypothetical protein
MGKYKVLLYLLNIKLIILMILSIYFLKGFSRLLICGGESNSGKIDQCEAIDLKSNKTCQNPPNFPSKVYGAIEGLVFTKDPIICGGSQSANNYIPSNMCYSLKNNEWKTSKNMSSARTFAAAAQLKDDKLLVTGGYNAYISYVNSAEILTEEGWESNIPSLPVTIYVHCMVTVNSTTVMAIGGDQSNQWSVKSFFFTFGEESWIEGPDLKNKRSDHSCGRIRRKIESQEMSIIVAGGHNGTSSLSSVEILGEDSNEWLTGPELPFGIDGSRMVDDQNGGVILIGGKSSSLGYLDTLYQLPHGGQDAVWTRMDQKMKTGRWDHTAFMVPDNIVDCS